MYRRAADLPEQAWRKLLWEYAGVRSITDERMGHHEFAKIMPVLELHVEQAVQTGACESLPRRISNLSYWRGKSSQAGQANARKLHRIQALYGQLAGFEAVPMEAVDRTRYLLAMLAQAAKTAPPSRLGELDNRQCDLLIEALKSRLSKAARRP